MLKRYSRCGCRDDLNGCPKTIVGAHLSHCECPSTHKSIQIDTHARVEIWTTWANIFNPVKALK